MESIVTSLLTPIIEVLSNEKSKQEELKRAKQSLVKLLLIECRINIKILDIANHSKVDKPEQFQLLQQLKSDAATALFSFTEYSSMFEDFKALFSKSNHEDESEKHNDLTIVSIISKIELLKILSNNLNKLSDEGVVRIKSRIKNLHTQLSEIIPELNQEIAKI